MDCWGRPPHTLLLVSQSEREKNIFTEIFSEFLRSKDVFCRLIIVINFSVQFQFFVGVFSLSVSFLCC